MDLDPTDGLPVQRYTLQTININQDATIDPSIPNAKSTNSLEWQTQFESPVYPWKELPVPNFYKEIPTWNQEMIRRARTGNTKVKLSVWDRKDTCWISASEAEKRNTPLKSLHLNNLPDEKDDDERKSEDEQSSDESKSGDDEDEEDNEDEEGDEDGPFKAKRRKVVKTVDERLIEVKKWVQIPASIAEKTPERSFLAKRREGMPALYQPEYATKLFGRYHSSSVISGSAGYDLGEGGGLANASGVLAVGDGGAMPRKNIPPRRKKKKLGGPGRKKANPVPVQQIEGTEVNAMEGVEVKPEGEIKNDGEAEENESGSEAEGSEEGEIDESGGKEKEVGEVVQTVAEVLNDSAGLHAGENVEAGETVGGIENGEVGEVEMADAAPEASGETTKVEATQDEAGGVDGMQGDSKESIFTVPSPKMPESPGVAGSASIAGFIPGLGALDDAKQDPEEREIIEENAQAIALTDEPEKDQIVGVSEAITEAVMSKEESAEVKADDVVADKAEVDLLGAMDAAIDQGMQGEES